MNDFIFLYDHKKGEDIILKGKVIFKEIEKLLNEKYSSYGWIKGKVKRKERIKRWKQFKHKQIRINKNFLDGYISYHAETSV